MKYNLFCRTSTGQWSSEYGRRGEAADHTETTTPQ